MAPRPTIGQGALDRNATDIARLRPKESLHSSSGPSVLARAFAPVDDRPPLGSSWCGDGELSCEPERFRRNGDSFQIPNRSKHHKKR